MKKVLITSYYFEPEVTPRAFRSTELVKELLRRGYKIDLFIPNLNKGRNIGSLSESPNLKIHYVSNKWTNASNTTINKKKSIKYLRSVARYLLGEIGPSFYSYYLFKKLLKDGLKDYELIISIGLPFYIHVATALFISKTKQKGLKVCDYGDPFYFNPEFKRAFYLKNLEKWVLDKFNFITIPTIKSINYYVHFKAQKKIKVIPQGFDFSSVEIGSYKKNEVPSFCYAGYFYENVRNPEFLFKYLETIKSDFKFVIYTDMNAPFNREICLKYKDRLKDKLEIKELIPREKLIVVMSEMDFLVNFDNLNSNQVPSKIVDYTLSGRPYININEKNFSEDVFQEFIDGIYKSSEQKNIDEYNIKNVVDKFENLSAL